MLDNAYEVAYVGIEISGEKFVLPVVAGDPAAPVDGWMWYDSNLQVAKVRAGGVTISLGAGTITDVGDTPSLNLINTDGTITGQVLDSPLLGGQNSAYHRDRTNHTGQQPVSSISDFATEADARIAAVVTAAFINALAGIDSDTLNGLTAAQIQAAVTTAIVDTAPGTLNTLNEIAEALGDDPDFLATITALANSRARTYVDDLTGGATTEVKTHNLNTFDLIGEVYIASGNRQREGYIIEKTTLDTVTVVSESGNIPAGRRLVILAVGT